MRYAMVCHLKYGLDFGWGLWSEYGLWHRAIFRPVPGYIIQHTFIIQKTIE